MSASDTLRSAAALAPTLSPDTIIPEAQAAAERGDLTAALAYWAELRDVLPGMPDGYVQACELLRQQGQFDAAEELAARGMRAIPNDQEIGHQHALVAFERGDHAEAARLWAEMSEWFPDFAESHQFAMLALRLAERVEEAERLAPVALAKFEDEPGIWTEYILLALHRGDWTETAARAESMRELLPDAAEGYRFGIMALRESGQWDAAETLGEQGLAKAAHAPEVHHEHALTALLRDDPATAASRWQAMRLAFPDAADGFRFGVIALRAAGETAAADDLAASAIARFPDDPDLARDQAVAALERGDAVEAARILERLRAARPEFEDACHLGVIACREAGRLIEAAALAAAGRERFPHAATLAYEQALTTLASDGAAAAAKHIRSDLGTFPDSAPLWRLGAFVTREADLDGEAENIAAEGVRRFPDDPEMWRESAFTAFHRGDLEAADRRWQTMRERFPDNPHGYMGGIMALRHAAPFEEADRLIITADEVARAGLRRFPDNEALWREHAFTALHSRDWPEAVRRWRSFLERFPNNAEAYRFGAVALRNAGRAEQAEELLREGLRVVPDDPDLWVEYATGAVYAGDTEEAVRRWEAVRRRFPDLKEGYLSGIVALREAGRLDDAEALQRDYLDRFQVDDAMHLMMRFESLGDTCEFGLVQRHFGAEPLGLLRWSSIDVPHLVAALEHRFDRVGEPDNVEIHLEDETYMIADDTTGFRVHSFVNARTMSQQRFLEMSCRWLRYLKDKLLRDLAEGEKIFVFKPRHGIISEAEIQAIHRQARAYGNAPLLCLRLADERHPNEHVEVRNDGLMIGYISQVSPSAYHPEIQYDSWLSICRAAAANVPHDAQ